jgi:choice-of-anchor C domain-containing protein
MRKRRAAVAALCGGLMVTATAVAGAAVSPVADHSFEAPPVPLADPATGVRVIASPAAAGAWAVTSGDVEVVGPLGSGAARAHDSQQSLDLNGTQPGRIEQVVATTAGATYELVFYLAGNPFGDPGLVTLDVGAGAIVQSFSFDRSGRTPGDMGWERRSLVFAATAASTTISFQSTTNGSAGPMIDDVSALVVEPDPVIPEFPLIAALPLAGLATVGGAVILLRERSA